MAATSHASGHLTSSKKLGDQAASAALSSSAASDSTSRNRPILDEDGKLSSASAATSLKYAKPQDLPSFPSAGLNMSSAGAAATMAENNKKSFEHWKPEKIPTANRAAMLAKDYEMKPLWQPEASSAGSKAAMMAHQDTIKRKNAEKEALSQRAMNTPPPSTDSQKKALMAAASAVSHNRRRSGSAPVAPVSPTTANKNKSWAMKAANKSHADGAPVSQGGEFTVGDPGFEAARIQNVAKNNVNRQLYGSAPPVAIEVQEKNRQDTLRASAVAMAQKMYAIQQQHIDEAAGKDGSASRAAATRVRSSTTGSSTGTSDIPASPNRYENLEEAARRLAQERLAKIHDEHAEYRNYYGASTSPPKRGFSMRLRRNTSGTADPDDSDEEQSRRIKSQMSLFTSKLAEVDNKKRQTDRDALLQIAHRNVEARLQGMDDKVFQETGKASPAQLEKWEKAAREKAQRDSDARMANTGKVHIGGGKYLDQAEVDAIARSRLQPTLDEISEKAEKQRAMDEEQRMERERVAAQAARDRARENEIAAQTKAASDKQKAEEKARVEEEKRLAKEQANAEKERKKFAAAAEKERKQNEAAAAAESKAKGKPDTEDKRKSRDGKSRLSAFFGRGTTAGATGGGAALTSHPPDTTTKVSGEDSGAVEAAPRTSATFHDQVTDATPTTDPTTEDTRAITSPGTEDSYKSLETGKSADATRPSTDSRRSVDLSESDDPTSPSNRGSRVKSWMKVRFRSKSNAVKENEEMPAVPESTNDTTTAATDTTDTPSNKPTIDEKARSNSMRDVAMAGRSDERESEDMYGDDRAVSPVKDSEVAEGAERSASVSSLSSVEKTAPIKARATTDIHESDTESRGRKGFKARLLGKLTSNKEKGKENEATTTSPDDADKAVRVTSTDDDEFEEARDTFDEQKLAPPPPLSTLTGEGSTTKTISPKGSRERSKFTEQL